MSNEAKKAFAAREKDTMSAVALAIKTDKEGSIIIRKGFAAAFHWAMAEGDTRYLNELVIKLTPGTSLAMRGYGVPAIFEQYGEAVGYEKVTEGEDVGKWKVGHRPFQLVKFVQNPSGATALDQGGNRNHYQIVAVSEGSDAVKGLPDGGKRARALKKAIIDAGVEALAAIEWVPESKRLSTPPNLQDTKAAGAAMERALKVWAKGLPGNGKTVEGIKQIAILSGLGDVKIAEIMEMAANAILENGKAVKPVTIETKPETSGEAEGVKEGDKSDLPEGHAALMEQAAA